MKAEGTQKIGSFTKAIDGSLKRALGTCTATGFGMVQLCLEEQSCHSQSSQTIWVWWKARTGQIHCTSDTNPNADAWNIYKSLSKINKKLD